MHRRPRQPHWQGPDARSRPGVLTQGLQRLAYGAELRGADVVRAGSGLPPGQDAGCREICRMDELVLVVTRAEHGHCGTVCDPVEQDAEDAQATVPHEGPRLDDRYLQAAGTSGFAEQLASVLLTSIRLDRCRRCVRIYRIGLRYAEHRTR